MENIMTTTTPLASSALARVRMSAGAFAGAADFGGQARGCVRALSRAVRVNAYTPAIVDVVKHDDFPGVQAWSPPV